MKAELETSQQTVKFFEILLKSSKDGIIVTDAFQNIILANDAFCGFLKVTVQDVIETNIFVWLEQFEGNASKRWTQMEKEAHLKGYINDVEFAIDGHGQRNFSVNASFLKPVGSEETGVTLTVWRDITERMKGEENVRKSIERKVLESEATLKRAQAIAHLGSWTWNIATAEITWSDEMQRIFGYEPGIVVPTVERYMDHIHPDDRERVQEEAKVAARSGNVVTSEHRIVRANGETLWVSEKVDILRNNEGAPVLMLGTTLDITERKRAEGKVLQSEEKYYNLFDYANDSVFIIDPKTRRFIDVNKNAANRLGYTKEELLTKKFDDISIYSPARVKTIMEKLNKTGSAVFEAVHIRKDGSEIPVEISSRLIEYGGKKVYQSFVRDITERKLAEEKLQISELNLIEAQRISHLGSWELDLMTNELKWSDEVYRIFEIELKELGASYEAFLATIHPHDREFVNKAYTDSIKNKTPYGIEHRLLMKDGRVKYVHERCETFYDDNEKPLRSIGTVLDITEQKRLQSSLIRSEKLSSIGTFVAGVAHELNNPLTAVIGYSDMLLDSSKDISEETRKDLNVIIMQSERAARIVANLLKFARNEKSEKHAVKIDEVLESTINLQEYQFHADNIKIVRDYGKDMPLILADDNSLQQVFMNILVNAHDAMMDNNVTGEIRVKTEYINREVVITIENDGLCIPKEKLFKVFDPFFTTKQIGKGTGLGLSVSQGIIKDHQGNMAVENIDDGGVRFIITLPVPDKKPVKRAEKEAGEYAVIQGMRVLFVDDEEGIRDFAKRILTKKDVFILTANNGEEAIKMLEQGEFDAIISDLKMPVMGGLELGDWLRENKPDYLKRFVIATGAIETKMKEYCDRNNCYYIQKPYKGDELYETLNKIMKSSGNK
jgi:PAS domain S-box-containing protein